MPLFTQGFSPAVFLSSVGIVEACPFSEFDREPFTKLLARLLYNPTAFVVSGFVVNPTMADLKEQLQRTTADLLIELGKNPDVDESFVMKLPVYVLLLRMAPERFI